MFTAVGLGVLLAACGGDADTESAAADEGSQNAEATVESTSSSEPVTTTTVTTAVATSTTAATTTTTVFDGTCSAPRFEIIVPDGWSHQDCFDFSEGEIPDRSDDAEFRSEIDVFLTPSQTYREAIGRVAQEAPILSGETVSISGAPGVRLVTGDPFTEESDEMGERVIYVADAGDGVFFAAGVELTIPFTGASDLSVDERYSQTVGVLDELVRTIQIDTATPDPVVCSGELVLDETATVLNSGEADLDGDEDLEVLRLVVIGSETFVEIEGLAKVEGNIVGVVELGRPDAEAVLGWADWDGDGFPEIFTREPAGPSFGDVYHVHSVNECEVERVATLTFDVRDVSSNTFVCDRTDDGTLNMLTTQRADVDATQNPATVTANSITSIFAAGINLPFETSTVVTNDRADLVPPFTQTEALASCATFF